MSLTTTIALPNLPPDIAVHATLFSHVANAAFLRQQLLAGNTDFEYAFIDASTLLSTTHILAAVFRAINDLLNGRLKTRNVHSEIVFSLSPNNNIAESFRRFGIADSSAHVLAIKVAMPYSTGINAEIVSKFLGEHVRGTPIEFTDDSLRSVTDIAAVRKIYKLNAPSTGHATGKGKKPTHEVNGDVVTHDLHELEVCILGIMALKGS